MSVCELGVQNAQQCLHCHCEALQFLQSRDLLRAAAAGPQLRCWIPPTLHLLIWFPGNIQSAGLSLFLFFSIESKKTIWFVWKYVKMCINIITNFTFK